MRRILSFLLILSFVVVLTPRSLWHSHDHDEHEKHSAQDFPGKTTADEDCFVCDFDLSHFTATLSFEYNFPQKDNHVEKEVILLQVDKVYFHSTLLRGPPSIS